MADQEGAVSHFDAITGRARSGDEIASSREVRAYIRDNVPPPAYAKLNEQQQTTAVRLAALILTGQEIPDHTPDQTVYGYTLTILQERIREDGFASYGARFKRCFEFLNREGVGPEIGFVFAAALFGRRDSMTPAERKGLRELVASGAFRKFRKRYSPHILARLPEVTT